MALVGGFFGGLSGIWGPPLVMYLLALELPKAEMVRVQSLSFLLGSLVLLVAHLHSGVLNAVTLPASAWLVLPTMAAMFVGYRVHDRLDQDAVPPGDAGGAGADRAEPAEAGALSVTRAACEGAAPPLPALPV